MGEASSGKVAGGKYAYMSPEQAAGDEIDHRSDIYSAGIVLWELLVGYRLFQTNDTTRSAETDRYDTIPDPRTRGVQLDDGLWKILQKALSKDPKDRFQSASNFEESLRVWQFDRRHRVGAADISAMMQSSFPDIDPAAQSIDVEQLVNDLKRLDRPDVTDSSIGTADTSLPGKLKLPTGARKEVVAVWVDIDGLTDLSARVDPEQLFKRHYQLLRWTRRIIDDYQGILQRSVDDHILLLFGVPRTQSDDIDRAVQCALHLQSRHHELESILATPVGLAIGIHTGEVAVNAKSRRIRYVSRGDTTRLARRLSAAADHGEVLLSDRVFESVSGLYQVRKGPTAPSRGGKAPVTSYCVERRRIGTRIEAQGEWIRRGNELETLSKALTQLGTGTGSSLMITGDVGVGKSRLVGEIRRAAKRNQIPFYSGFCALQGQSSPLRTLVHDILDLDHQSNPRERKSQLEALKALGLTEHELKTIEQLIQPSASGPPKAAAITGAVQTIITAISEQGPLIVNIESVHNLGRSDQLDLLEFIGTIQGPCLFLLTHTGPRPEWFAPTCVEVALGPFPQIAQHRLLRSLLNADDIPLDLVQLVEQNCEGNPLYITSLVNFLLHQGHVVVEQRRAQITKSVSAIDLPHSMAGLIASRIDALDPAAKGVLQVAGVIGPIFSLEVLSRATGIEDVSPIISDLVRCGLIHKSGHEQTTEWSFSSMFVRESALRGTLGVQRRDYHRLVASAIEALHGDALEDWHEALIEHCFQAGRALEAVKHAFAAGERHAESQYLERAHNCYRRGLSCLEKTPKDLDSWDFRTQAEAMLYLRLGVTCLLMGDTKQGESHIQISLEIASEYGLSWIVVPAHLELGKSFLKRHKYAIANAHLQQARALLEQERDDELELQATESAALLAYEEGRNDDAERLWREALSLCIERPADAARCRLGLANRFERAGEHERSITLLLEALQDARLAGDRIVEGRVLNNIGIHHSHRKHYDEALYFYQTALQVREGVGYMKGVVINHHNIGDVHFSREDYAKAAVAFDRSRELANRIGDEATVLINDVYLGYIDAMRGLPGVDTITHAVHRARVIGDGETVVIGQWLMARWHASQQSHESALAIIKQAQQDLERWGLDGMKHHLAEVSRSLDLQ